MRIAFWLENRKAELTDEHIGCRNRVPVLVVDGEPYAAEDLVPREDMPAGEFVRRRLRRGGRSRSLRDLGLAGIAAVPDQHGLLARLRTTQRVAPRWVGPAARVRRWERVLADEQRAEEEDRT